MLYHKITSENGTTKMVDLYEDEIFSICPSCGIEQEVDTELLQSILTDGDFGGTSVYCAECTKKE
ncbi:hypothetical protein [Oceanobacillus sp. J11TS1]|uniref:hypothetical protein n=1 Tax=Oceanobacillus sp. J11TS1 TaxID=2807191 RepID=UPI001B29D926|nr:hypothetical protein [Oceanobacillus sp. J11TS1]GIO23930.1 hypothetical protein J11TS1_25110 [Oceanobacillus sp. J11TS1]